MRHATATQLLSLDTGEDIKDDTAFPAAAVSTSPVCLPPRKLGSPYRPSGAGFARWTFGIIAQSSVSLHEVALPFLGGECEAQLS